MRVERAQKNLRHDREPSCLGNGDSGMVNVEGEAFYRIERSDQMPPFLINLVSPNNHWMFIASNGALTAGRRDSDNALFPYITQDKLFELADRVGPLTLIWVKRPDFESPQLWEPFHAEHPDPHTRVNLYKNVDGNKLIFEEQNDSLGLSFRYMWTFSDQFGFVRKALVENHSEKPANVRVLDGIQNLVPYGLDQAFVNKFSNLADAYKKCELLDSESIGIYYLSSVPTDRAEPSEGLRATIVWSQGTASRATLLSTDQIERFRKGEKLTTELDKRGVRGAYFTESSFDLKPDETREWWLVADINQDAVQIESLRAAISSGSIKDRLEFDIQKNLMDLRRKVGSADGLSLTSNPLRDCRHYSNVLFNIMRGGVFNDGYAVDLEKFLQYIAKRNRVAFNEYQETLERLRNESPTLSYAELVSWASDSGSPDLVRLAREYLPLTFSRRHGDPSRPWNRFSIETQDKYGDAILGYEGNWRDIFQNWEALAYSYPGYLNGMIARFLNSSTADGYNPYRITQDGIEWEGIEADSPWSNIGYWGDHQIVYLLKLLEALDRFDPKALLGQLDSQNFVYAQVPYRIRSFADIWKNPRETVDFSDDDEALIESRCDALGSDGKLLLGPDRNPTRANLVEKLLNPLMAKLSNFVPDGGIWMNTQRPEWNDANNALVGYGVSVVTLCYVNRYVDFLLKLFEKEATVVMYSIDEDIQEFLITQLATFQRFQKHLDTGFDPETRMRMVRLLGKSGETFRNRLYERGLSGLKSAISSHELKEHLRLVKKFIESSIDANRRSDALYHSYNLLEAREDKEIKIDRLPAMLEGQVAALSSGRLSFAEALALLESLRSSALYREDVNSYILYPDKELPTFLEKNVVAEAAVKDSPLLTEMLSRKDPRIIQRDLKGKYRFSGDFRNSEDLAKELEIAQADYADLATDAEMTSIRSIFDDTFDHRRFTGRSSTFFAYEGLGSVYWHMVSKLVLAIQENWIKAVESNANEKVISSLAAQYFETFAGLGLSKTPEEYGAFPVDAYSHTPKHAGAQQPGMTGQVKEDVLSRFSELGLNIEKGIVRFIPGLLASDQFLTDPATFSYVNLAGEISTQALVAGELAFTFCQTLFVYAIGESWAVRVIHADGTEEVSDNAPELSRENSAAIFARDGSISEVRVTIPRTALYTTFQQD